MILPSLDLEKRLWQQGYNLVCGLDEVGRGSFAGPVVVGAVIFSPNCKIPEGIADSKLLKPRQREKLAIQIKNCCAFWSVAEISVSRINKVGIGKATQMAFRKVIKNLDVKPDFILIDAFNIKHLDRKRQRAVKNGDNICVSISAASIIAKVYRDRLMKKLHKQHPKYKWSKNKGYGTKDHREMIRLYGLTRLHRRSFNLDKFL